MHTLSPQVHHRLQNRLFYLATGFLFIYSIALSFGPAIRDQSLAGIGDLRWMHWIGFAVWLTIFAMLIRQSRHSLALLDPYILPIVALLSGWGLMSIWRLTSLFGARQTLWIAICGTLLIYLLRTKIDLLANIQRYKYLWLISGFLITTLTFFFGTNPSGIGPDLWLGCCGVFFQPSEPLKLLLIIFLAAYIADRQYRTNSIAQLLMPTIMMAGVALLLLLIQRDLGTAWVFLFIYTSVIFATTGDKRILLISAFLLSLALFLGYQYVPLVNARISTWVNPWTDPSGSAYQIVQGLLSIANGGLFGRGPGLGYPNFVPVAHSDYIYTALVEESGLLGSLALLILIGMLVIRAIRIALLASSHFQRYLAVGIAAYFGSQSLLIIGGTLRLLPLTGVPLPLVSYGGSSLLTSLLAILLLALISQQSAEKPPLKKAQVPERMLAFAFMLMLALTAVTTGWWAIIRGPDLLARPDNAREVIPENTLEEETSFFSTTHAAESKANSD